MNTKDLIDKAISLPVEERALLIDSLPRSLNQPESAVDDMWAIEAKRRLTELKNREVEATAGKEVFDKIWNRFEK